MSPYMLGDAGKLVTPETPPLYDLYAVVNHYGAVHIGHYTAIVKPPCSEGTGENYNSVWSVRYVCVECMECVWSM